MWTGRMRGHPGFRVLYYVPAAAFDPSPAGFGLRVRGEVVVEIESAVQAGASVLLSRMTAPMNAAV